MTTRDAVDALQSLGLSQYEAAVFVALRRLDGTGTASDVAEVADVPRSQVYGAAERLEQRGLVEIRQSSPIQYRAVGIDEARRRLAARFEREQDRAFDALAAVESDADATGEQEAVWTVTGGDAVAGRAASLVADATARVVYAADPAYLDDRVRDALVDRAGAGVDVVVVSAADVAPTFEGTAVETHRLPESVADRGGQAARLLVVDDGAVLLSVRSRGEDGETAIWSAGTEFATVLIRLVDGWFGGELDL